MCDVYITVQGGIIQNVEAPVDMRVIVLDYDTDSVSGSEVKRDDDGHAFTETIWTGKDSAPFRAKR
jgi:hypothetical protein